MKVILKQDIKGLFSFRIKSEGNAAHISAKNLIGSETEKIRTVNRVAGYLADHYQESSSLDELASRFFTNKFYLTRIFKQVTGFTIREYLHIQRVQKAQEFLRSSLLPITEIALMVGFENVSYFEKIFRRYCIQNINLFRASQQSMRCAANCIRNFLSESRRLSKKDSGLQRVPCGWNLTRIWQVVRH